MNVKPRAVFDTQVLLRAAVNRKSLPARLLFELRETYQLVASPATMAEARDVLNRPGLRNKFSNLTDAVVEETLAILEQAQQATPTEVPTVSRDPKDDIFLACAVVNEAQFIVTEDKDFAGT